MKVVTTAILSTLLLMGCGESKSKTIYVDSATGIEVPVPLKNMDHINITAVGRITNTDNIRIKCLAGYQVYLIYQSYGTQWMWVPHPEESGRKIRCNTLTLEDGSQP